jgi:hypothetical protein
MTSYQPQDVAQAATDASLAVDLQELELEPELYPSRLDTAKIFRNKLRNTPLLPGSVSERARSYRLERLEKRQYEKEREKERTKRLDELNTGNLAKSPRKETAEDIVEQLKGLCDVVIDDYRHLPEKMGYNRRKVVKTSDVKPLNTSKSRSKGKTTAIPKDEQWMTEEHLFSTKSKLPVIDLHVRTLGSYCVNISQLTSALSLTSPNPRPGTP